MSRHVEWAASILAFGFVTAASAECWIERELTCCSTVDDWDRDRVCGLFGDQECPDQALADENIVKVRTAQTGLSDRQFGASVVCEYRIGRCSGSIGWNLCKYNDEQTIACTNSYATGDECSDRGDTFEVQPRPEPKFHEFTAP